MERRAQALAADVEDDAAEYLAYEDDALVDELLRDPEIQRAIAPSPQQVVESVPPPPPPQEQPVVEAFTTPIEQQPLDPRQLRCLLRVRSALFCSAMGAKLPDKSQGATTLARSAGNLGEIEVGVG